ncbi:MAG: restriction endonuclease subunit S [Methyloversatilis sp.]|nr:restriction endonuclease subunit S [Methyloversatilis sp.]
MEWLGAVPAHWAVKRFKWLIERNDGGVWGDDPDGNGDTIVLRSTDQTVDGQWRLDEPASRKLSESERRGVTLEIGDLLVTKSSGSALHIGKTTLVDEQVAKLGACYSNFMQRFRLNDEFLPKLAWYVMNNELARRQFDLASNSTTGLANLNGTMISEILMPVPSALEQAVITAFLDREIAKIDALIAEQEKLIALLAEKRQATISHAVTRGLNPDAPMKDSGVPWLGEVPAHWDMKRVKDCGCEIVDCKNRTPELHDNGDYFVVRTSCVKDGKFNPEPGYRTDEANFIEWTAKGKPRARDVLFTREAPTGEACLAPEGLDFCLGQRMMYIRPPEQVLLSEFLLYSIYGGLARERISEKSKGSTVGHLRIGEVGELPLLLPPLVEQHGLVEFVRDELAKIESLEVASGRAIALLKERRSALIAAAVTGQIDVRGTLQCEDESTEDMSA